MKEQIDKQAIEEMAKETTKHCEIDNQCGSCHWSTCNECLAEVLYNAGYRKIDEGSIIIPPLSDEDVKKMVEKLKSQPPMIIPNCIEQEWINVDERLPDENGRYLVCVAIRRLVFEDLTMVVIMGYNKINGFDVVSGEETVTHWMPLPEPPKMKGGAE